MEENKGLHCTNECVMRQGLKVPKDLVRFTEDRLRSGKPLCDECINDIKTYFDRK